MQEDFHYYATYCAALLAGYSPEESRSICYCANFPDLCSRTFLSKLKAPVSAATTQLQLEMVDMDTNRNGLQEITRIWASFHFLPRDLFADVKKGGRRYKDKYRLICGPNGALVKETVELAKGKGLQAAGLAMHILADTWAHRYFAGTPSLVINNTNFQFWELTKEGDTFREEPLVFRHSASAPDDLEKRLYTSSLFQISENAIMNLGHGRVGHLPDYSFFRYKYLPAWKDYEAVIKDNPKDYMKAFCQMIYALKYLRGENGAFETDQYDETAVQPYREEIKTILEKRQLIACEDWKAFGRKLSGEELEDFALERYSDEYRNAPEGEKDKTFLGQFILAALAQKSMVTNKIYSSGNKLAGISVDYSKKGFRGNADFRKLIDRKTGGDGT